jgi:hypothetical protein
MPGEKMARRLPVFLVAMIFLVIAIPAHGQSAAECAARAERAERNSAGLLGGALGGGAGGAVFGAIVSDKSGRGAKRGAGLGAIVGGAAGAYDKNKEYKRVYDECMSARPSTTSVE